MPSLFARHRHTRSTDTTTSNNSTPSTYQPTHLRKPSLTESGPPSAASASASSGLLGNLKAKLNASRVSLHEDDPSLSNGANGGKRRFSIGQAFASGNSNKDGQDYNAGRRNSIALVSEVPDSPPTNRANYPPGTKIMPTPPRNSVLGTSGLELDENRRRRESADL